MMYNFKLVEEMAWFGFVSAGVALLEVLIRFDPETITSWETWAISLGGGLVRAFAGGFLAAIANRGE